MIISPTPVAAFDKNVVGLNLYKVEAPDLIGVFWPQPNAGSVIEPKGSPLYSFLCARAASFSTFNSLA